MKPESQCSATGHWVWRPSSPSHSEKVFFGIIVETVGGINEANKGTGNRLLLFSESKYHYNLWEKSVLPEWHVNLLFKEKNT